MKIRNIILGLFLFLAIGLNGQAYKKCCDTQATNINFKDSLNNCADAINDLVVHPANLDNDPTNEIQTLTPIGNATTGTTAISISGGNTISITHPPAPSLNEIYCSGDFENGTGRTGWWRGWTAVTQNANVPNTLTDWVNISNARTSPDCITDMTYNVNLGNHLIYIRRIRAYVWVDYRLLINGAAVNTKTYHSYLYEDERNDTNPDVIPAVQYQIRSAGSGHGYRLNVPASSTVQIQARVRYQAVGFQPSSYFRYIGGLRSEVNFSFNPRTELTDVSLLSNDKKYWVLEEYQGATYGVGEPIDGAKIYSSESEYLKAIEATEIKAAKERDAFEKELQSIIQDANNILLSDIKTTALSTNALSTILGKYRKAELKECADKLGLEYGNSKISIAKSLIEHYNKK